MVQSNRINQKTGQGTMVNCRINVITVLLVLNISSSWAQEDQVTIDHSHHFVAAGRTQSDVKSGKKLVITSTETADAMEAMPSMDHSKMNHDAMQGIDSKEMSSPGSAQHSGHNMSHSGATSVTAHDMSGMSHSSGQSMPMQGGSAPSDARDPHAYSDGYDFGPIPRPQMSDEELLGSLLVDRLESATTHGSTAMTYDWQAWFGGTYNRVLIRAEGDIEGGTFIDARNELLWAHAITDYWDTQLGVRYDSGQGIDRGWLAFGVQGTAPYWIYVEATAYVNEQGRTTFRLETEYDLLLTQRLILQPRIETNIYSQRDDSRNVSSGVSDFNGGVRLRYEIWREFAPYVGVEWASKFGSAADKLKASGQNAQGTLFVAGVHFWF
jgi:copper resistance protein B